VSRSGSAARHKEASPSPQRCENQFLSKAFKVFCGEQQDMDYVTFAALCRHCFLFNKLFTAADADLVFSQVVLEGRHRISQQQLEEALRLVAEKKGMSAQTVRWAVMMSGPSGNSPHTVQRGSSVPRQVSRGLGSSIKRRSTLDVPMPNTPSRDQSAAPVVSDEATPSAPVVEQDPPEAVQPSPEPQHAQAPRMKSRSRSKSTPAVNPEREKREAAIEEKRRQRLDDFLLKELACLGF